MSRKGIKKHRWTEEELKIEALKYNGRWEFQKKSPSAYKSAFRKNILDQICSHMNQKYRSWTDEMLHEEALKYKTRGEFQKFSNVAYQISNNRKILTQICSHMQYAVYPWTNRELQIEALKYGTRSEFEKNNNRAYDSACGRGKKFLDEICSHMTIKTYWTDEMLHQEALKYKTRSEFQKMSASAYQSSSIRKILDEICSHMTNILIYWTNEMLQAEALKYNTRGEFREDSPSAYSIAYKREILDQICSHMKRSINISSEEEKLLAQIKFIYPKAKKIRDASVKILNKPHIHKFDIDIYIPELRKGIEFDGKYWHSFEGLKRSRSHWPENDLRDYHQLKDDWFLSKGIKIFHIKEEDWLENKKKCIQLCLEFLGELNER